MSSPLKNLILNAHPFLPLQRTVPIAVAPDTASASPDAAIVTWAGWGRDAKRATPPSPPACPTAPATDDSTKRPGDACVAKGGRDETVTSVSIDESELLLELPCQVTTSFDAFAMKFPPLLLGLRWGVGWLATPGKSNSEIWQPLTTKLSCSRGLPKVSSFPRRKRSLRLSRNDPMSPSLRPKLTSYAIP